MRATLLFALVIGAAALQIKEQAASAQSPGKAVFYSVIMGAKYTRRHQVSLWLSSLRSKKMGNWAGEAIIVTDKPACLAKTLEETQMIGKMVSSNDLVDIYEPPEGFGMQGNLHIVKRPHTGNILKIKLEKARAWINARNAGIEGKIDMIVWTDEDIVMGKDVNQFVEEGKSLVPAKHTLALFRDTGKSKGELHTGVVIMYNSPDTEECLRAWGRTLTGLDITEMPVKFGKRPAGNKRRPQAEGGAKLADQDEVETEEGEADESENDSVDMMEESEDTYNLEGPDQQALGRTKACSASTTHQGIKILPKQYFWFPNPSGMEKLQTAEFIHFTNTGRWMTFPISSIRKYLTDIGIPEHIDPMGHSHSDVCLAGYNPQTPR